MATYLKRIYWDFQIVFIHDLKMLLHCKGTFIEIIKLKSDASVGW